MMCKQLCVGDYHLKACWWQMSQNLETDHAPQCKVQSRQSDGILSFVRYIFVLLYSRFQIKRTFLNFFFFLNDNERETQK